MDRQSETQHLIQPTDRVQTGQNQMNRRIAGYDFARLLALFGLVLANFSGDVGHDDFHRLHTFIQEGAVATFLLLGGVGISLLKQRNQSTNAAHTSVDSRKRLIKRAASLLVVGICCNLIWHTNFLCRYSICIAIGALLLTVSNRWLWSLAFVFVAIFVVFIFLIIDYSEIFRNWEAWSDSDPWTVGGMVSRLHVYGFHRIFFLTALLLIGMWSGRQEVHYFRVRKVVFFGGIVVALVSACTPWLLIRYSLLLRYVPLVPSRPTLADISGPGINSTMILLMLFHIFAMCGIVTAIIGGSLMLTERYSDSKWTRPFIATGQLALTLYVGHLIVGGGVQKLLEVLENQTLPFTIGSAIIFCICAVIFSHFWRKRFERGPLEWGIRRITG